MDGDADRLLYFVPQQAGGIQLLDGDRIAVLAATLLNRILQDCPKGSPQVLVSAVGPFSQAMSADSDSPLCCLLAVFRMFQTGPWVWTMNMGRIVLPSAAVAMMRPIIQYFGSAKHPGWHSHSTTKKMLEHAQIFS